jgi:hypothetical protein
MRVIDAYVDLVDSYLSMAPFDGPGRLDRLLFLMDKNQVEKAVMVPVVVQASPHSNEEGARWARSHPSVTFIINHLGYPGAAWTWPTAPTAGSARPGRSTTST